MTDFMKEQRVGVGLIGCGNFAQWQHLPNLMRSERAELRWVCDIKPSLVDKTAGLSGARGTCEVERIWEDDRVEAVVIAVRDHQQAALCEEALAAGKKVYLEKPAGASAEEIKRLLEASGDTGTSRVVVGFQKRFAPAYKRARILLDADGGVHHLSLRMVDDAWRWASHYPPGSLLAHDVCHLFDLARWFCRAEVETVYALRSRPDDDALLLRMTDGTPVSIMSSGHGTMDMPKERLEGLGYRGGVVVDDFVELRSYGYAGAGSREIFPGKDTLFPPALRGFWKDENGLESFAQLRKLVWRSRQDISAEELGVTEEEYQSLREDVIPNFLRDQGWMQSIEEFLRGVASGDFGKHATLEDAHRAALVVEAAYKSLESGGLAKVSPVGAALSAAQSATGG